jgi:lysyl endopeptidase
VKRILSISFILFFCVTAIRSQISEGGIPPGLKRCLKSEENDLIDLPSVDTASLIAEDLRDSLSKLKPYRFAFNHPVNLSIHNSGKWETLDDGSRLWKIHICSKNAYSLMVIFSEFDIPKGAQLYLYDKNKEFVSGAYTAINNNSYRTLSTHPVPGDLVTVEYLVPSDAADPGKLTIGMVCHDYTNALKDGNYGRSKSCEVDINCDLGKSWQLEKRAVCRLFIPKSDGYTYICTGTLVNNTSQNGAPFILSANHCINDQYAASKTLFDFNYESPYCKGPDGSTLQSISTGTLKATTTHLDFSLTEMSKQPPFSYYPYYAGWSINTTGITNVVTIHHPAGDVKKISTDNSAPVPSNFTSGGYDLNTHWKIAKWDNGATEGGSSGSALYDQQHRIIGTLSGGGSACGCYLDCADYYEMFAHSWADYTASSTQLKYWLDPLSLGVKTLNGWSDLYLRYSKTCDTVTNIKTIETPVLLDYSGWGYLSGTNSDNVNKYAESFNLADSTNLVGVYLGIAKNKYAGSTSSIYLNIWESGIDSFPGKQLMTQAIRMNSLEENKLNFISLYSAIKFIGKIFVGLEIYYNSPLDTFALFSSPKRTTGTKSNTAYVMLSNNWFDMKTLYSDLFGLSLQINPVFCDSLPPGAFHYEKLKSNIIQEKASCYPNPSDGNFTLVFPEATKDIIHIEIFNTSGCLVFSDQVKPWQNEYHGSLNADGIYIIHISCSSWVATSKIIISR